MRTVHVHATFVVVLLFSLFVLNASFSQDLVASLPGDFSVSNSGAAQYSIPIEIPPGTAGVQPSLSFNYSSQGKNGLLGVGWSIGGLSLIHRCPTTLVRDGFVDGIDFDNNDRFCLDGQVLVPADGNYSNYGADQKEYRTETDAFFKVISYGSTGNGPAYFKVWTKSGEIMEFGNTTDSQINPPLANGTAQSDALCWLLNKVSDTVGNYMNFVYFEDAATGENYPLSIEYTGNASQSVVPYNSIKFEYEARPDVSTKYIAGLKTTASKRLKRVFVEIVNAQLLTEYNLAYEAGSATGRSLIDSIQRCDLVGDCILSTNFDNQQPTLGWSQATGFNPPDTIVEHSNNTYSDSGARFVDLNGDGLSDFVYSKTFNGTWYRKAYLNTGSGWSYTSSFNPPGTIAEYDGQHYADSGARFVDLNGDGLPDFVYSKKYNGTVYKGAYLNTGTGWSQTSGFNPPDIFVAHTNNSYSDAGARFVDLNGDGLPDFVYSKKYNGTVYKGAYLNTGSGWSQATGFNPPDTIVEHSNNTYSDSGARFVDLNGDGLSDFVYSKTFNGTWYRKAYLNTGSGWSYMSSFNPPGTIAEYDGQHYADSGARFVDLNGDGLSDFVYSKKYNGTVLKGAYLNTGSGWSQATGFNPPDTIVEHSNNTYSDSGARFVDLNGDGLSDFVYSKTFNGTWYRKAYLNTGSGWSYTSSFNPPGTIAEYDGQHYADSGARFEDLNGDGLSDFVYSKKYNGTVHKGAYLNTGEFENLLNIDNALDSTIEISYQPLTNSSVYTKGSSATFPDIDLQAPMYVVSATQTDNGIGGQNAIEYIYEGARINAQGRGFLGFASRTVTDVTSNTEVITNYRQDFPYIGSVSSSQSRVNGVLVGNESNTYSSITTSGAVFPYTGSSTAHRYDPISETLLSTVTTDNTYDNFGNPTFIEVKTDDVGIDSYTTTTNNTYTNNTNNWHLGRLTQSTVVKKEGNVSSPARTSAFEYHATTGLLTKEIIEPGNTNFELTKTYTHDGFGHRASVTTSGPGIVSRTTSTVYDSNGRYPVSTTNALGHVETYEYNDPWGGRTKLTGPNLLSTSWTYDSLGRTLTETRADGSVTTIGYTFCDAINPCPQMAKGVNPSYFKTTTATNNPTSVEYFDAVNRVVLASTQSFDGAPVYVQTEFDARARSVRTSNPYFTTSSTHDNNEVDYWTVNLYDAFDRVIQETSPVNGITTYAYSGFEVTVTNDKGQEAKEFRNSLDQVLWTEDDNQNKVLFDYDARGNLITVTDSEGNVTTNTYNLLGHKIGMVDPDMGVWSYSYNALGELVSQTDAKNQTVTMQYDVLGRMISRAEPEGTSTWGYDSGGYAKGKISSESHYGGFSRTYVYDGTGRLRYDTRTISGISHQFRFYYIQGYKVNRIKYPSGFIARYEYNNYGYLEKVKRHSDGFLYWQADAADEFGNITIATLGNGVLSVRDYEDNSGRLKSIITNAGLIQNLNYTYDSLGNLIQRNDAIQSLTEDFGYDNLNRLTTIGGVTKYSYDSLGNLLTKDGVPGTYQYNSARPHAVTNIGNKSYQYDANGNMVSGDGRNINWSSFNKPTNITKGNASASFQYGPDRARYQQTSTDGTNSSTITYIGGLYEVEQKGAIQINRHYIQANGETIAIFTDRNNSTSDTRYLRRDHLGSVDTITDENGNIVEKHSFDAFGHARLTNWSALSAFSSNVLRRGFTGHEMLEGVGLIHMNGRVYDPTIGRFLSADPFVQAPKNLQNLNRYSYVINNPLSYTDPSGFIFGKIKKAFKKVVKAVVSFKSSIISTIASIQGSVLNFINGNPITGTIANALACSAGGPAGCAAYAAASSYAATGDFGAGLKAGAIAFGTASAANAIGKSNFLGGNQFAVASQRVIAHGVVGGVAAEVQGRKFSQGFASSALVNSVQTRNLYVRAIVGGTASELSGGKFANGAATAAVGYLYEEVSIVYQRSLDPENFDPQRFVGLDQKSLERFKGTQFEQFSAPYPSVAYCEGCGDKLLFATRVGLDVVLVVSGPGIVVKSIDLGLTGYDIVTGIRNGDAASVVSFGTKRFAGSILDLSDSSVTKKVIADQVIGRGFESTETFQSDQYNERNSLSR